MVVDNSSISEQKLINKIKNDIKLTSNKKELIIIHNIKNCRKLEYARYYINNILLKSSSFKLMKNETITSKKDNKMHGEYYTELYENDLNVFHLIYAADKSETGSYLILLLYILLKYIIKKFSVQVIIIS